MFVSDILIVSVYWYRISNMLIHVSYLRIVSYSFVVLSYGYYIMLHYALQLSLIVVAFKSHFSGNANRIFRLESSRSYSLSTNDKSFSNFRDLSYRFVRESSNFESKGSYSCVSMVFLFFLMALVPRHLTSKAS